MKKLFTISGKGGTGQPYCEGAQKAKMTELAEWIKDANKVITF